MEEESQFCRLCLTTSVVYYSLLKNNGKEMVFSLTGMEIEDDDLSTESCAKCWLDLKLAYFIQQCFVEAEKKLKGFTTIKNEEDNEIGVKTELTEEFTGTRDTDNDKEENGHNELENETNNDTVVNYDDEDDDGHELIYIETEEKEVEKPSICSICGIECPDDIKLYSHINTHYDTPQVCDECSVILPNIPAFRAHLQSEHPALYQKTHICGICSLSFKYRSLYSLHLTKFHSQTARSGKLKNVMKLPDLNASDSPFKCEKCNKVFVNEKIHTKHMANHVKSVCNICGAILSSQGLKKHIQNHQTNLIECDICGVVCRHIESLKWHKYYTHKERRKRICGQCGQEFKKLYTYRLHLKKHAGETPFVCTTCDKGFITRDRLKIHIRSHTKERPYKCTYCNETFTKRQSLRIHERKHTMERPYVCEVCGEGFMQNLSLRSHRKSKHNIIEALTIECDICKRMFKDNWALRAHKSVMHE